MDLGLRGKKAFVTGASKGIGLRIARLLADEGADIGICARNADAIAQTAIELRNKGIKVHAATADLHGNGADLKAAIDGAAQAFGGLDILVQNVSALSLRADEQGWELAFQTDVLGTLRCVEAAMPYLKQSSSGSIVVIGTALAVTGAGGPLAYGGIKASLLHYVSSLARSLAPENIRANTVSPGAVYFKGGVFDRLDEEGSPDFLKETLKRYPMGRMATPEEVANAVVFIASPAASYITGVNLMVDGGSTARVQY